MRGAGRPASAARFVMRGHARDRRSRARRPSRGSCPTRARRRCRSITGASAASRIGVGDDVGDVERVVHAVVVVLDVDRARARERRVQHLEVVAHEVRRPLVREAEHVGDDPVVRRTEAEREPAFAHRLVRERLLRHRDRVAGLDRHHRGAELDARRRAAHQRDGGERVEVVRDLRHPDRGEARPARPPRRRRRAARPCRGTGPSRGRS